ncbi:hypothetical protein ACFV2H_31510 [Streptomyces sp. NPDC059629]|uniref:hypothetical protein n=1 Tax=Streptomyces sp. NPDC059629 TaxID=3346889 RepID=UPI00368E55A0
MPAADRIIGQLYANHAANIAAGLGSPALDDVHNLVVEMVAEAPDPKARMRQQQWEDLKEEVIRLRQARARRGTMAA